MNIRIGYTLGIGHMLAMFVLAKHVPSTWLGFVIVFTCMMTLAIPVEMLLTRFGQVKKRTDLDECRAAIRVCSLRQSLEQIADSDMTEPAGRYYRLATEALAADNELSLRLFADHTKEVKYS